MFLVGTSANMNIIKFEALDEGLLDDENEAIEITGITQSIILNIGTVNIEPITSKITFHVIHSNFPISTDGILGREYLRQEKVEISFWHNTIVTHSNSNNAIPVIENESRVALESITDYKGTMLGSIQVRARTRRVVPIAVINSEIKEGYLPVIKTTEGD